MICDRFCQRTVFHSPWAEPLASVEVMDPNTLPHYCTRRHTPRRMEDFQFDLRTVAWHKTSSHHALALLAAPRPKTCLSSTLASLKNAGIDAWPGLKMIYADGTADFLPPEWMHVRQPVAQGSASAFLKVLRHARAEDPSLEHLTFLEDDIDLCQNALDYMALVSVPNDVAFLSWFTYDYDFSCSGQVQFHHPNLQPLPWLAVRSTRFFILTQACTFPRRTIDRLLACPHITGDWPKQDSHDEMIGWALGDALYAVHFPILVQHTGGLNSAVLQTRGTPIIASDDPQASERSSPFFVGTRFDARSLLPQHP